MNLQLKNKSALVCGSTQGIGKATAILLAQEGANVTLLARNEEKLKLVLDELPNHNQNHNYLVADFLKPNELKNILQTSDLQFHILVNNTGGPAGGPGARGRLRGGVPLGARRPAQRDGDFEAGPGAGDRCGAPRVPFELPGLGGGVHRRPP